MDNIDFDTSHFISKYEKNFSTATNCVRSILTIINYILKPYCDSQVFPFEFITKLKYNYSIHSAINSYLKSIQSKYSDKIDISDLSREALPAFITFSVDKILYKFLLYPNPTNNETIGKVYIEYYNFESPDSKDLISSVQKCVNNMISNSKFNIIVSNHVYLINKGFVNTEYEIINKIISDNSFNDFYISI